jgi:hypothetical protein
LQPLGKGLACRIEQLGSERARELVGSRYRAA